MSAFGQGAATMKKTSPGSVRRAFQPWNDPAAKPLVEFRGVTKRFGNVTAVGDLSLLLYPREFFAPDQAPARLSSLREKAECLQRLGIDRFHVFRFDRAFASLTAEAFIEQVLGRTLPARYVLVGDDFRYGAKRTGDFALLQQTGRSLGFDAESLPTVEVTGERASSTAVRSTLAAGELGHAARLLGRPYSISGRVVHGDKLGRDIGFPTANIQLKHNRPPLMGIFAVAMGIGLAFMIAAGVLRGMERAGLVNDREIAVLLCDASPDHAALVSARLKDILATDAATGRVLHPTFGVTTRSPAKPFSGSLVGSARAGLGRTH